MSTKIFFGLRWPMVHFSEGLDFLHDFMLVRIKAQYDEAIATFPKEKDLAEREYKLRTLVKELNEMAPDNPLLGDAGYNIWLHGEHAYAIPFGPQGYYQDLWAEETKLVSTAPSWLKDYHYQNQVDKPENIPDADWDERADTWDQICCGVVTARNGHFARRLTHFVFEAKCWFWPVEHWAWSRIKERYDSVTV